MKPPIEIARDVYTVLAIREDDGSCQVLDHLEKVRVEYPKIYAEMMALLQNYVPVNGPPFHNVSQAKRLRNGICEFKARDERIMGHRVLFFEEEPCRIICTNACYKTVKTPPDAIPTAEEQRGAYWSYRRLN